MKTFNSSRKVVDLHNTNQTWTTVFLTASAELLLGKRQKSMSCNCREVFLSSPSSRLGGGGGGAVRLKYNLHARRFAVDINRAVSQQLLSRLRVKECVCVCKEKRDLLLLLLLLSNPERAITQVVVVVAMSDLFFSHHTSTSFHYFVFPFRPPTSSTATTTLSQWFVFNGGGGGTP